MKKNTIIILMALMIMCCFNSNIKANSLSCTLDDSNIYYEDFEKLDVNSTQLQIYQQTELFWFSDNVNASIIETEQTKKLNYTFTNVEEYIPLGGIGVREHGNLSRLVKGVEYELTMKVKLNNVKEDAILYIEYQSPEWTGVKLYGNGMIEDVANNGEAKNISYVNETVKFSFIANDYTSDKTIAAYIKLVAYNFDENSQIIVDDFKIKLGGTDFSVYQNDFQNEIVGTKALKNQPSDIANIYNADVDLLTIKEDENNKYLYAEHQNDSNQNLWAKFYLCSLTPLIDGNKYRISFDFLDHNFNEFYIAYNESGLDTATYTTNSVQGIDSKNNYIINTTFDGTHLEFDFIASKKTSEVHWQQIALIMRNDQTLSCSIDNVKIQSLDNEIVEIKSKDEVTLYIGDEINLTSADIAIVRKNGYSRKLISGEYIIDESQVDKMTMGEYPVIVTVVDENLNKVSKTIKVKYIEDSNRLLEVYVPYKLTYLYNEDIDLNGLSVYLLTQNNKRYLLDESQYKVDGYDKTKIGSQVITISAYNMEQKFLVQVEDYIETITIEGKSEFEYGEELSIEDFKLYYHTASGNKKEIENAEYKIEGYDKYKIGNQLITISYDNYETKYNIMIVDTVKSISIISEPLKVKYYQNEKLDLSGCKIEITYQSGKKEIIDVEEKMVEAFDTNIVGNRTIIIKYGNCVTNLNIEIVKGKNNCNSNLGLITLQMLLATFTLVIINRKIFKGGAK